MSKKKENNIDKVLNETIKDYKKALKECKNEEEKEAFKAVIKKTEDIVNCKDPELKKKASEILYRMQFIKMELLYLNGIYNTYLSGGVTLQQYVEMVDWTNNEKEYVERITKTYTDLAKQGLII